MTSQYTSEPKQPRAVIVVTAVRLLAMNTDSESSTTGFSKNQPRSTYKSSLKRGIAAVLQASTNIPNGSKRIFKTSADSKIHQLTARCAPRGNPAAGATAR